MLRVFAAGIVIGQSFSQNRFSFLVPNDNRGKEYLKNAEPRTGKSSTTEVATGKCTTKIVKNVETTKLVTHDQLVTHDRRPLNFFRNANPKSNLKKDTMFFRDSDSSEYYKSKICKMDSSRNHKNVSNQLRKKRGKPFFILHFPLNQALPHLKF